MADTENTTEEVELDEVAETNGAGDDSMLDQLRSMHQRIGADRSVDIDIPGYHGKLVGRFRRLDFPEVEKIGRKVQAMRDKHNPLAALYGQCDVLGESLTGFYLRKDPAKREEIEPLSQGFPQLGEGPVLWDGAAKLVSEDGADIPDTVRGCIRRVINNDLAVAPLQAELALWMQTVRSEDEEDFSFDF